MPIRMTDDEKDPEKSKSNKKTFFLITIFVFLGGFLFKYPKLIIPILAVGLIGFLCIDNNSNNFFDFGKENSTETLLDGTRKLGAKFDTKRYDKAPVYEPLSQEFGTKLPSKVSLLKYAPRRLNQGDQGSCTGWAVSYAARTILHAQATGEDLNKISFSPAYLFNQNTDKNCDGAYPVDLLDDLKKQGNLQITEFPYSESSCRNKPSKEQKLKAKEFRIEGYQRLTEDGEDYQTNIESVKQYLSQGSPIVISMEVGGTFLNLKKSIWLPSDSDYQAVNHYKKKKTATGEWGGHAMTAIGYDDNREGGAFQIMNSWGEGFANQGIFWLRYEDFNIFVREVYAFYPPKKFDPNETYSFQLGLINNATKEFIPLKKLKNNLYQTVQPIPIGTRFKVSVKNDKPIYLYIFGLDTDGSSYVLFPYTDKHSPYCGTKGTRVFPKKQSLEVDPIGKKDNMIIVLSKKQLDYKVMNRSVNQSMTKPYFEKFQMLLQSQISKSSSFGEGGDTIELVSKDHNPDTIDLVKIEFEKK